MNGNYLLAALIILPIFKVAALTCIKVEQNEILHQSDETCLAELQNRFKTFTANDSLKRVSFSLIRKFDPENQDFIIDHVVYEYCKFLQSQSGENQTSSKEEQLTIAKTIFSPGDNEGRKKVHDTRSNLVNLEPNTSPPQEIDFGITYANSFMLMSMDMQNQIGNADNTEDSSDSIDTLDLLREPPFVITKRNRHFAMVGSADDLATAKKTANDFKKKHPQFDFVAYDRYEGNPYSIMMATWVSYAVAAKAVEFAKIHIQHDSLVWSCRGRDGVTC